MVSQVWEPQLNVVFLTFIHKKQDCTVRLDPLPILIYSKNASHLMFINHS